MVPSHSVEDYALPGQTHAVPRSDLWIQSSSWGSSFRVSTRLTCTVQNNLSHRTGFRGGLVRGRVVVGEDLVCLQFVVFGAAVDDALDAVAHLRLEVDVAAMHQHPLTLKRREARETWGHVLKT